VVVVVVVLLLFEVIDVDSREARGDHSDDHNQEWWEW